MWPIPRDLITRLTCRFWKHSWKKSYRVVSIRELLLVYKAPWRNKAIAHITINKATGEIVLHLWECEHCGDITPRVEPPAQGEDYEQWLRKPE
jgi:hypothetical protein